MNEESVGIKHYSTKSKGINGRIKQRISDFLVSEKSIFGECKVKRFDNEKLMETQTELKIKENKNEKLDQMILEMEKFNLDSLQAIKFTARFLGVSKKRIGFAGIKDKRAVTSQKISLWQSDIERLKKFKSKRIDLRFTGWSDKKIELGDLEGNYFNITIRELELEKKELVKRINASIKEISKNGVINYFSLQRFGGIRLVSHEIGKLFLKQDFEKAVKVYLTKTNEKEKTEIQTARKNLIQEFNYSKAVRDFPKDCWVERVLIHHLCKNPTDFKGAIELLPLNFQYLFTHAYQSFLFNTTLNKLIERNLKLEDFPIIPILGCDSEFSAGVLGEIEKELLKEENITFKDFYVKSFPKLSSKGSKRQTILFPENLKLEKITKDEINEGKLKAIVSFYLSKGNYATTILREIMKN
ncbi:MAG: tRNA pseudouridine(13) synthase TruD [archaeon]